MKRRILIIVAVVAALLAVVFLVSLIVPPAEPVATAEEREIVETLVATGQVTPESQAQINAEVGGEVLAVEVEEGEQVEAGQLLVRIDDRAGQARFRQAEAAVSEARARLRAVSDQRAPAAESDLDQARQNLEAARRDLARAEELYAAGVIPEVELEQAQRQLESAEIDLERAQTALGQAAPGGAAYAEALAMLARAEAERDLAAEQLTEFDVHSPVSATVLAREVEPGTTIQPGATLLLLASEGPVNIRISPDERELGALEVGQSALAVTDAFPGHTFSARVHRINPQVDPERGTVAVLLRVEEGEDFLRANMTVSVEIELDRRDQGLVIPREAVRDLEEEPFVLRFADGRAEQVFVQTGLSDRNYIEIVDGLAPGDEVLVSEELEPGDRVRRGEAVELPETPRSEPDVMPDTPEEQPFESDERAERGTR